MSKKNTTDEPSEEVEAVEVKEKPKCFVIMPISDHPNYEPGHFGRVYTEIIRPAIELANFEPKLATDVKQTHVIILDILQDLIEYDMAICDLSSLNPNVLYELGVRQMARKPVLLIKEEEERTKRIFDIGLLSDIPYHSSLRVDRVKTAINEIAIALRNTYDNFGKKKNSLIDLIGIKVQVKTTEVEATGVEKLILDKLNAIERQNSAGNNINKWLNSRAISRSPTIPKISITDYDGEVVSEGDIIINRRPQETRRDPNASAYLVVDIQEFDTIVAVDLSNVASTQYFKAWGGNLSGLFKVPDNDVSSILLPEDQKNLEMLRSTIETLKKAPPF